MDTREAIKKIYDDRKDFLIIGLTGRTGSGCSTVASILKKGKFEVLDLKAPKKYDFNDSEERKYSILYEYARADNWSAFHVIEMRNIIASFIYEKGFKMFIECLKNINKFDKGVEEIRDLSNLIENISELEDIFNQVSTDIKELTEDEDEDEDEEKIVKLYQQSIVSLTAKLKDILQNYYCYHNGTESQLYTYLFQKIGNNLRASGEPYESEFIPNRFFTLAERTNYLIKVIRRNKKGKCCNFFCIDAIRNPYEAIFFKDRYSAFYLLSVNTDDIMRRRRLADLKVNHIESLDEIEYPKKLDKEQKFYSQNIKACLEITDIHIYNPNIDKHKYYFLTEQLLKYVVLMMHPGLITPTHLERCMQIAYNAKLNSGCLSRQVGAVVTGDDYSIKAVGWNEVAKGQVSCSLRDVRQFCDNQDLQSYSHYELTDEEFFKYMKEICNTIKYDELGGRFYPYCFKDVYNEIKNKDNQVYTRALHAEENAFLQITKYGGVGVNGGFLFTTASPCELCAKKAYQLGIKKIFYIDPYPGISETHILKFGSENNPELQLFYGAIGNAYISLYTQRISYKDELAMVAGTNPEIIIKKCKNN